MTCIIPSARAAGGAGRGGAAADVALEPRGSEPREEPARERLTLDLPLGPRVAVGKHRGGPVRGDDLLQTPRHLCERVVPGDALEAALAPLAGGPERMQDPVGAEDDAARVTPSLP